MSAAASSSVGSAAAPLSFVYGGYESHGAQAGLQLLLTTRGGPGWLSTLAPNLASVQVFRNAGAAATYEYKQALFVLEYESVWQAGSLSPPLHVLPRPPSRVLLPDGESFPHLLVGYGLGLTTPLLQQHDAEGEEARAVPAVAPASTRTQVGEQVSRLSLAAATGETAGLGMSLTWAEAPGALCALNARQLVARDSARGGLVCAQLHRPSRVWHKEAELWIAPGYEAQAALLLATVHVHWMRAAAATRIV